MTKTIDLYYKRKDRGQCVKCGTPSTTFRCVKCKEKHNSKSASLRTKRAKANLCIDCGETRKDGYKRCDKCLHAGKNRQRNRFKHAIDQNLCTTCKHNQPVSAMKQCQMCLDASTLERHKLKMSAFNAYGGLKCACVGCPYSYTDNNPAFLTIDHVNGGGAVHRRSIGVGRNTIYGWLKSNSYPSGFQVLCWCCNSAKHLNGNICPHQSPAL